MSKYYIIFDTNILYRRYDKRGDFNEFSFSSTFQNVIDTVNEFDLYEYVTIVIPNVVWNEMIEQEIESHDIKLKELLEKCKKFKFPEIEINSKTLDYRRFIVNKVSEYKSENLSKFNKVIDLPLPTRNRFDSIVERAFDKRPPFEGKDTKSDKGFKDALLWESILEFSENVEHISIILYTKDNIFTNELEQEYNNEFLGSTLKICNDESQIRGMLKLWLKEIDEYAYIPNVQLNTQEIEDWLNSDDCIEKIKASGEEYFEENALMKCVGVEINNSNVLEVQEDDECNVKYDIELELSVTYQINGNQETKVCFNANIDVNSVDNSEFTIVNFEGCYGDNDNEVD